GQAYRWEISPDGLTYRFHLRPGLVWSDGAPITAFDFLWSWRRVLEPATRSRYAGMLYPVRNGEAFNQGALHDAPRLGLPPPDESPFASPLEPPPPYSLFATPFYPFLPVPRHVIARYGELWERTDRLVGNGPFRVAEWRVGDRFVLVPNPR